MAMSWCSRFLQATLVNVPVGSRVRVAPKGRLYRLGKGLALPTRAGQWFWCLGISQQNRKLFAWTM